MLKLKDRPRPKAAQPPRNSMYYQNGYNHAMGLWGSKEGKDTAEWNRGVAAAEAHKAADKQCKEEPHDTDDHK